MERLDGLTFVIPAIQERYEGEKGQALRVLLEDEELREDFINFDFKQAKYADYMQSAFTYQYDVADDSLLHEQNDPEFECDHIHKGVKCGAKFKTLKGLMLHKRK
eukprot:1047578-Karenia_brevis.AAC.1